MKKTMRETKKLSVDLTTVRKLDRELNTDQLRAAVGGWFGSGSHLASDGCAC